MDTEGFHAALSDAIELAKGDHLLTFGVVPDHAETGYGYIRRGAAQGNGFVVDEFVEKPDAGRATEFLATGGYLWNSGMFVFKASAYLDELQRQRPTMADACKAAVSDWTYDLDFIRVHKESFIASPSESIDYAVMEQAASTIVIPLEAGWSDIGSWDALWSALEKDDDGNAVRGEVLAVETRDSLVMADRGLVATLGVRNLTIVDTPDALLVADRDHTDELKSLVAGLLSTERSEAQHHRKVYRPWGSFDAIEQGEGFQVKRITVDPGRKLSLQRHQHRAEHWIVVRGMAEITLASEVFTLKENQSTYIPPGTVHRLANVTQVPLEIIEVQTGTYLGEDDIERLEDDFHRSSGD